MHGFKHEEICSYKLYISSLYDDNKNTRLKLCKVLKKALTHELTQKQNQVLRLYYYENLKQKDIALLLNIDKSVVSRHLSKAKAVLENFLEYNIYLCS